MACPRLYLSDGLWRCTGCGRTESGPTVMAAYMLWLVGHHLDIVRRYGHLAYPPDTPIHPIGERP